MDTHIVEQNHPSRRTWVFFALAIGFSWLFWVPAAIVDQNIMNTSWVVLLYAGGLGPALAAIFLIYIEKDPGLQKEYWSRVFSLRRIKGAWYLAIFLLYPVITGLISVIENGQIQFTPTWQDLLARPLEIMPFILFLFIFGPFPEELGWRGYALDGLQERMNPVAASLILGAVWAAWHIPLFLMEGTYQQSLGFGSAEFWRFILSAILISVFFTWIYNNNQRSILSASLFHFSVNLTGNIIGETGSLRTTRIAVLALLIIILVFFTRKKGLLGFHDQNLIRDRFTKA